MSDNGGFVGHCVECKRRVYRYHGWLELEDGRVVHSNLQVCATFTLTDAVRVLGRELNPRGVYEE